MIKKESPVKRWPGYVLLADYMSYPQLISWKNDLERINEPGVAGDNTRLFGVMLNSAIEIVAEWHIDGLPEKMTLNTFPASNSLAAWITNVVTELYQETNREIESEIPKSPEPSTDT